MAEIVKPFRTKGSHIVVASEWVDGKLGPNAFQRLLTESKAPAEWFNPRLISSWYSVDVLLPVLRLASQKLSMELVDVCTEIARQNALKDLRGVYSIFLRVLNPVNLLRFTPALWRNYVDFAEAKAVENRHGFFVGECTGFPERFMEWVCGDWLGFIPTGIELAGGRIAKSFISHKQASDRGLVRLEVHWT